MGTNYYLRTPEETLHIGKSSGGWCFALHVIPENGLNTLNDWLKPLYSLDNAITNEYGDTVLRQEMLKIIIGRKWSSQPLPADFHAMNYSEPGPNGLVRCKVDGVRCIGHGEGTWDYITGECYEVLCIYIYNACSEKGVHAPYRGLVQDQAQQIGPHRNCYRAVCNRVSIGHVNHGQAQGVASEVF